MMNASAKRSTKPGLLKTVGLSGLFALSGLVLIGCESGSSTEGPPAGNSSPVVTSAADPISITENTSGVIYTFAATDSDGDALTLALSTTSDFNDFVFDETTGELSFANAPDFEVPTDGNGDNVYRVSLTARDPFLATGTVTFDITVTDVVEPSETIRVVSGLTAPVATIGIPGTNDLLVVQKTGEIKHVDVDDTTGVGTVSATDFLDISADIGADPNHGLLGIVFASTTRFLVSMVTSAGNFEVREYTLVTDSTSQADATTENLIIQFAQPASTENAGWIGFDASGFLLITTSDGAATAATTLAQDPTSLLGKVLRINTSTDGFSDDDTKDYSIPSTNPYADGVNGAEEVWAIGLNNPATAFLDLVDGFLYVGDRGEGLSEELSRISLTTDVSSENPVNFGWPIKEGTQDNTGTTTDDLTAPVIEYLHSSGLGNDIVAGRAYRGIVDQIEDRVLFADNGTGTLWSIAFDDIPTDGTTIELPNALIQDDAITFSPDAGSIDRPNSYGLATSNSTTGFTTEFNLLDEDGEVFIIRKVEP